MLTKNEINVLNLSPTKKDFVQIWNELLEVAGRLSERWDPTSTNESDPGIVILKALAGIADKLNYNIDKNTLEAFMPTAAQEDSMRKLCEMLGYSVKYYQSAKTEVTFKYYNPDPSEPDSDAIRVGLYIPKFTVVTNSDQDINYFTIPDEITKSRPVRISLDDPIVKITCMEGQLVKCESSNDYNIITTNQISIDNRFYLPETQIAENGIFVYNIFYNNDPLEGDTGITDGTKWEKVDNLNTQPRGSKVYKFGFDSYEGRPYIEFPEDYSNLFNEGLFIYYTRTRGINGNISAHTLTQLELPSLSGWDEVTAENFSVDNVTAATTGANVETIKQAYNNFKKTIGTFDTLVTCRDYMNKIYNMVDEYGNPEVSNILVTDIRNDINRAITICSCDDFGILYKEKSLFSPEDVILEETETESTENIYTKPYFVLTNSEKGTGSWYLGNDQGIRFSSKLELIQANSSSFDLTKNGVVKAGDTYWEIQQNAQTFITKLPCRREGDTIITKTVTKPTPKIDHFDLVFYPFKSYKQIKSSIKNIQPIYDESFKCVNIGQLTNLLSLFESSDLKTIPHVFKKPEAGDIISINNYLRLNATIATTSKLTAEEGTLIIQNIKKALANAFNMRELDFGEEIPFESIVEVIEKADARIKIVSLNEPSLYTTFSRLESTNKLGVPEIAEYAVASKWLTTSEAENTKRFNQATFNSNEAKKIYNQLVVRNILAGRVPLFKYNKTFQSDFYESPYLIEDETITVENCPTELVNQKTTNLYNIFWSNEENCIYTRRKVGEALNKVIYSRVMAPYASVDNVITAPKDVIISNVVASTNETSNNENSEENSDLNNGNSSTGGGGSSSPGGDTGGSSSGGNTGGSSTPDDETNSNPSDNSTSGNKDKDKNVSNNRNNSNSDGEITEVGTYCEIIADKDNVIRDLTLANNEYVTFRAPNYTTEVTYPAYVNYHLKLATELANTNGNTATASNAIAQTLYEIINTSNEGNAKSVDEKRQLVLNHFNNTKYKKRFTITQKISKYTPSADTSDNLCTGVGNKGKAHVVNTSADKCAYCGKSVLDPVQKGPIQVLIKNDNDTKIGELEELLAKSSFIKLLNKDFKARLEWDDSDGDRIPESKVPLEIQLKFKDSADASYFITDEDIVANIQLAVSEAIAQSKNNVKSASDPTPILPTACAWTVSFDFECVPFEPASIREWEKFIRTSAGELLGFTPFEEVGALLWRTYGSGYESGKYILDSTEKLLKFDSSYYNLLPSENVMRGVYLVKFIGKDAELNMIKNNVEYTLQENEYLFIEYTESSTDESAEKPQAKTVVYPAGTPLRITGFDTGLVDSDAYGRLGNTAAKEVTFVYSSGPENISGDIIEVLPVYRLAASEQIEIRKRAEVVLSQENLGKKEVYLYKNFNNCPELELNYDQVTGSSIKERRYTLKDGEYVFYTDKNKIDFAYFGGGTEIVLKGVITIPECNILDIATILDTGVSDIPWQSKVLNTNDSIIFREFRYITLGPNDTILRLPLEEAKTDSDGNKILDDDWVPCSSDTSYLPDGADKSTKLPEINDKGNSWEVCSLLKLTASPTETQTLRYKKGVINTGLRFSSNTSGGDGRYITQLSPKDLAEMQNQDSAVLNFKTNLDCNLGNNYLNIDDLANNTTNEKGFKIKVFSTDEPVIVETASNKVVPTEQISLTAWTGQSIANKDLLDLWHQVSLDKIMIDQVKSDSSGNLVNYDNALALPVLTTTNTYGIICFYLKYVDAINKNSNEAKTWIEIMPGMSHDDVVIINSDNNVWESAQARSGDSDKLFLNPGINCVRFNKSGKYFIKTAKTSSEESKGDLYFADIKLIDCDVLNFTSSNNDKKKLLSNGLNLKQLGYFRITEDEEELDLIEQSTLLKLETALCSAVNENALNIAKEAKSQFNSDHSTFISALSILEKIKIDVDSNSSNRNAIEVFKSLLSTYNDINSTLTLETELLTSIKNKTADEKLLAFISQLATKEITQSQLSKALEDLKLIIEDKQQVRTNDQILASFKQNLSNTEYFQIEAREALLETKDIVLQQLNDSFMQELSNLVEDLVNVITNDDLEELRTSLQVLQESFINEKYGRIQVSINELIASMSLDEIYSLLESIVAACNDKDYQNLTLQLNNLKTAITTKETQVIMDEVLQAFETKNDAFVIELIELIEAFSTSGNYVNEITTTIETAIRAATQTYPNQATIVTAVNNVTSIITTKYASRWRNLLADIKAQLKKEISKDTEAEELQKFIDSIAKNDDAKILELLDKIAKPKATYEALKKAVKEISEKTPWNTIKTSLCANELKTVLISVWPRYLSKIIQQQFTSIEADIVAIIGADDLVSLIKAPEDDEKITLPSLKTSIASYFDKFAKIDQALLAKDQLDELISVIETMCLNEQKNTAITDTVKNLGSILGINETFSNTAQAKFNNLAESAKNRTQPIVELLVALANTKDPLQKAQLINNLKEETTNAKNLDTQLLDLIIGYICPNIISLKDSFNEDCLEYRLITTAENRLLGIGATSTVEIIQDRLETIQDQIGLLEDIFKKLQTIKDQFSSSKPSVDESESFYSKINNNKSSLNVYLSDNDYDILTRLYQNSLQVIRAIIISQTKLQDLTLEDKIKEIDNILIEFKADIDNELYKSLINLRNDLYQLKDTSTIILDEDSTASLSTLALEKQLLTEILKTDVDRDFYYLAPVDAAVAIDIEHFAEDNQTLLNPALNYDFNNINNSFVISKLDINYLDSGIQLARSSKFSY